jgi:CelD/BcsL family acetyltransferase involved in cellulose biosynthesis
MRRTIRGTLSGLENQKRISFRIRDSPEGAAEAMKVYVSQHRARWRAKGGSIFDDRHLAEFMVNLAKKSAERGHVNIFEVLIDGNVASQLFCVFDLDWVRAYRIGINNKYLEYAPGSLVVYFALKEVQRKGFHIFDFGKGAEEFKYRLGAQDRFIFGIHARRGSVSVLSRLASMPGVKGFVEKTGIKDAALKRMYQ